MIDKLKRFGEVSENVLLSKLTTLKIGGPCKAVFYPFDVIGLIAGIQLLNNENIDYRIFGHGSNILANDEPYEGVIIKFNRSINSTYILDNEVYVKAGASLVLLSDLAMKHSLSGLEWAAGIPATIGGALYMNAGAYKQSMSDIVKEVLVLRDNKLDWISGAQCEYGYRSSIFQEHPDWIILAAKLQLKHGDSEQIKQIMARRKQQRLETQPLDAPSCGSTFRNPKDHFSWELIQKSGFRGFSIGGAQVSMKHANFIINTGHATSSDMIKLIQLIQQSVKEKYQVDLQLEVEQFNWTKKSQ